MVSSRDLGLQSLQSGDVAGAIQQLEAACTADGTDYLAHIYLGAAYSQANRTMDAIQVLTRSVELQPSNAQGRYNLGLAMERGGFTEQAATAYEQAITLQPDYPKAHEALQRVKGASAGQPSPAVQQAPPATQPSGYGAPPEYGGAGAASFGAPPTGQPAPQYGAQQPMAASATQYGAPTGQANPGANPSPPQFGTPQYGMNPPPQYGAPQGNAYPPQTQAMPAAEPGGLANYGAPPVRQAAPPPPYGSPYGAPGSGTSIPIATQQLSTPAAAQPGAAQFILAFVLGSIGGIIGLVLWVAITLATHFQIGYGAIGVGALIGWMTKLGTRQGSPAAGVMAAIISFFSLGLGCFLTSGGNFSILFSIIFVVIGVSAAYRIAAR